MLNNIGLPGILLIAVVVLVLFGRGKISSLMGEVGKGITAFKKGVNDSKKELEEDQPQKKPVIKHGIPDAIVEQRRVPLHCDPEATLEPFLIFGW